ncbi:hypothetical protein FB451DRAFT_1172206 [Mycena latifolia]|nr:hypothetical protein FB451DRAFT_1172206 [Mycena latifolia]
MEVSCVLARGENEFADAAGACSAKTRNCGAGRCGAETRMGEDGAPGVLGGETRVASGGSEGGAVDAARSFLAARVKMKRGDGSGASCTAADGACDWDKKFCKSSTVMVINDGRGGFFERALLRRPPMLKIGVVMGDVT